MSFEERFDKILTKSSYTNIEKDIIRERYLSLVTHTEKLCRRNHIIYLLLANIVTIFGVLVTALIGIDKFSATCDETSVLYWFTLVMSISITIANKLLYIFNNHKKYIIYASIREKLYSEGWMFIEKTGRYNTKDNTFNLFCLRVEKIKIKSFEDISLNNGTDVLSGDSHSHGAAHELGEYKSVSNV